MGIPESTLRDYTSKDIKKRKSLGARPGRPSVVESGISDFVAQLAVRADRANDGSCQDAEDEGESRTH